MTIAIQAEGLGKKYLINHQRNQGNDTLRDGLINFLRRVSHRSGPQDCEEFWALKDVSFHIEQGSRVGIIGRNGAGKSTLLKILSRITEPSMGRVAIRGRVASLLEVGTGFHPELTGRENVFLNGAILGMRREEIRRKFDEIVAFAEVERFLDTPVKRYSSGMYVRLAFAVAAHLDPEILIVDEVLAVGDAGFQKKCLEKMTKAGEDGTTVLFVSHNIPAIQNLCGNAILLGDGRLLMQDEVKPVLHRYLEQSQQLAVNSLAERTDRSGTGVIRFESLACLNDRGANTGACHSGQDVTLRFRIAARSNDDIRDVVFAIGIDNEAGERIAYLSNVMVGDAVSFTPGSLPGFDVKIGKLPLIPGIYFFTLNCSVGGRIADLIHNAGSITVEPGDFFGTGRLPPTASQGQILIEHRFDFHRSPQTL
jgi:lipopolysaccharide transport system ATP-binding protein